MGAVGLLASGIAHDFNNTLTAARGYAELIRGSSDPAAVADADAILEAVARGQQLTRELLDFARKDEAQATVVDLRRVIGGIEPLIRRLIGGTVAVELRLPSEPVFVRIVVGQLEQALVNLALNARDAMPDGGVVTIALVQVPGEAEADIEVIDTGVGIPDTLIDTVFEPFMTTKPPGKGTGLGLAMVSGFAENASGRLTVRSEVGKGTTFSIRLPVADAAPPAEEPPAGTTAAPIGAS
jgi:signal transduction histidine kinase